MWGGIGGWGAGFLGGRRRRRRRRPPGSSRAARLGVLGSFAWESLGRLPEGPWGARLGAQKPPRDC